MESEDENVTAIRGSVMVYCTECGFANEQGNAFCSQCGSPLEQPEANPAAPAYDDNALTLVKQRRRRCPPSRRQRRRVPRCRGLWHRDP